ncbi:MAG: ATP-dependent zinc metalloprotease FtsH [Planctomycetota bacterium]|jgi:cell division protease FtsH
MSGDAKKQGSGNGGNVRRGRNIPLIVLLIGLAMVAFLQYNPASARTARITYSQFRELGRKKALENIEILHAPDHVQIEGKLKTDRVQQLLSEGTFSEDQKKNLQERERYRVEGVMRRTIDDHVVWAELEAYVDSPDKIRQNEANQLLPTFLFTIAPWLLIGAFFWFFIFRPMRQAGGAGGVLSFGRSRARLYTPEMTNVTFADVAGIEEAKDEVTEIIEFLRNPQKFQKLGGRIPRGVMLVGPPGCGKTLLAKAIAGEAGVPFFAISGSDFVEMFVGVGASRVRDLFNQAKEKSPCLIFLDEIDAVGRRRGSGLGGGHDEREQTLNQILVEMDGFETDKGIIVIAATNRPDVLDPALLRPGRFDRQITVDMPDVKGRKEILLVHSRRVKMAPSVDLSLIARGTPGFSGAELEAVINEAAIGAAMGHREWITQPDLEEARDKVRWGRSRRSRVMTEEDKKATAYHEAGHALTHLLVPEADELHKVTIIPRGPALGATMFLPERDRYTYGQKGLLTQLVILYAGRIAEEYYTHDLSTGAADDIKRATDLARRMVTQFGMSELGPLSFSDDEDTVFLGREITRTHHQSNETLRRIDAEIQRITQECYERAEKLLGENKDKLVKIAEALIEFETLSGTEVKLVLQGGDIRALREATRDTGPPPSDAGKQTEDEKGPDSLPGLDRGPAPGFA